MVCLLLYLISAQSMKETPKNNLFNFSVHLNFTLTASIQNKILDFSIDSVKVVRIRCWFKKKRNSLTPEDIYGITI